MIVALLPAYQAAKSLPAFLKTLPKSLFDEIILVDDSSTDNTFEIAKRQPGISVFKTPRNIGYGGNMKLGLRIALEKGADIIVEIHPDGEYLPDGIILALEKVRQGAKLVLGDRFANAKRRPKGMYLWKYVANTFLTRIDNLILGTNILDFHQGFRTYTKELLNTVSFQHNSNDFTFTFEIILQALYYNFPIATVPVTAVYGGKKRGVTLKNGLMYTMKSRWAIILYLLARYEILCSKRFF